MSELSSEQLRMLQLILQDSHQGVVESDQLVAVRVGAVDDSAPEEVVDELASLRRRSR